MGFLVEWRGFKGLKGKGRHMARELREWSVMYDEKYCVELLDSTFSSLVWLDEERMDG